MFGNPLGCSSILDAFGNMMSLESLDLSSCALEGEIPKSFMNLSRLRSLGLSYNNLTGQLPELFQTLFASKNSLETLDLGVNKVSGSLPDFTSFSSLRKLYLYDNKLNGSFPKRFGQSSPLEYLVLSRNELTGSLPDLTSFPLLRYLYLMNNKIQGRLTESIRELSNLKKLILSFNFLTLEFSSDWTPRFQLDVIILTNCMLGPHFPEWLRSQNNFSELDMSNAGISDTVPHWFWDLSPRLYYLNISNNQIHGMLPDLSLKFVKLHPSIDLSSNCFKGPIPLFPYNISSLNLSKNKFSGSVISLCRIATMFLSSLDLSNNLLSGEVPDCWIDAINLEILDLANNNFSWKIPASFGFLGRLKLLNLRNNSFIGAPSSLKNCTSLGVIDMSENKLSRQVLAWIGTHLTRLVVLSFRRNEFHGSIPLSMCLLNDIQVLDHSQNKISGNVPQCFNKFYSLIETESSSMTTMSFGLSRGANVSYYDGQRVVYYTEMYVPSALVQWKGKVSEYRNTLGQLKCIDLSSNKLIGQIPQELASLEGLISLNLSRNNLTGRVIQNISQMKMLEILDLSRNQLSGVIPIGLASLHFLNVLDLSSNNLSGKIPRSTQLDTFNASVYAGNDKLCGFPLQNKCQKNESTLFPQPIDHGKAEDTFVTTAFYVSVVLGFAIGFWGFIGPLMLRSSWRYSYFKLLDKIRDWIYVTISVNMARVQRKFRG